MYYKLNLPVALSSMPLPPDIVGCFKKKHDAIYVSGYIRGILTVARINNNKSPVYYHHYVVTGILNEASIRGEDIFKVCKKGFVCQCVCDKAKIGIKEYDNKITLFRNYIDIKKFHVVNKNQIRNDIR